MLCSDAGTNESAFPRPASQDSAAARPPRSQERMWSVSTVVPSLLTTGKRCVFSPPLRNSLLPMHVWKLRPEARRRGVFRAMKRQWCFRVIESAGLVFGYFWYNGNVHSVLAKLLS